MYDRRKCLYIVIVMEQSLLQLTEFDEGPQATEFRDRKVLLLKEENKFDPLRSTID